MGNVLKNGLDAKVQSEIYLLPQPGSSLPGDERQRGAADRRGTAAPGGARCAAWWPQLEPMAATDVATLASRVSSSVSQPRFAAALLLGFALLAITLAAIGLYGVLSYNVAAAATRAGRARGIQALTGARSWDSYCGRAWP